MMLYFEDFPVGFVHETEAREITREAILSFAGEWDPQPFHLDEAAAEQTIYGGLIASGWHTLVTAFRLWYDSGLWAEASMGSPGLEDIRWIRPVRPGDCLRVRAEVTASKASDSRPDRGRMTVKSQVFNQKDELVAEYSGIHLMRRRPAD